MFVDTGYWQVSLSEYHPSEVFHFLLIDKQLSLTFCQIPTDVSFAQMLLQHSPDLVSKSSKFTADSSPLMSCFDCSSVSFCQCDNTLPGTRGPIQMLPLIKQSGPLPPIPGPIKLLFSGSTGVFCCPFLMLICPIQNLSMRQFVVK